MKDSVLQRTKRKKEPFRWFIIIIIITTNESEKGQSILFDDDTLKHIEVAFPMERSLPIYDDDCQRIERQKNETGYQQFLNDLRVWRLWKLDII